MTKPGSASAAAEAERRGRIRLPSRYAPLDWLVGRLDAEAPALARRVAVAHSGDLVVVGRRDELPVLARLLDEQALSVPPELGTLRRVATAAVEAEAAAAAQRRRGRSR